MKLLCTLAAAVAALTLTASASARTTTHHRWATMTTTERRAVVVREIRVQRAPLRWWLRARSRTLFASRRFPVCVAVGIRSPAAVCAHARLLVRALTVLRRIDERIAAAARARMLAAFPPHHFLWMCIHGGEGRWDDPNSGHNGHWGGLQMTPGWDGLFAGTADRYSQAQQEWFAETGYRLSGYSHHWLNGQWGQTIGGCWGYA